MASIQSTPLHSDQEYAAQPFTDSCLGSFNLFKFTSCETSAPLIPVSHSLTFPGGSQDFSKRGSHCVKQRVLTSFSCPNIVGCSIEKRLTKGRGGGGHRYPRTPPVPARPLSLDPKE